ncbi:MAG: energy transducer TonB [Puia sp.]|nr:energy transducer TonB [Puia sp.]
MNSLVLSVFILSLPSLAKEEHQPVPSVMVFREYPKIAAAAKDSGLVVLLYGIDRDGNVVDVRLKSGNPRLYKYSKWMFEK